MKKTSLILTIVGAMFFAGAFAQTKTDDRGGVKTDEKKMEHSDGTADKAQMEKKAHEMATEWTNMMNEKLKLSADQKQKAMAVNEKYAKQLIELKMKHHNNPNADEAAMKAEKEKITQARFNEYKSFLSKEQMAQFKKERDSAKKDKMEGMTDEEKAQMKENRDAKKEKMENMTPEEKEKMEQRKEEKKKEKEENK